MNALRLVGFSLPQESSCYARESRCRLVQDSSNQSSSTLVSRNRQDLLAHIMLMHYCGLDDTERLLVYLMEYGTAIVRHSGCYVAAKPT